MARAIMTRPGQGDRKGRPYITRFRCSGSYGTARAGRPQGSPLHYMVSLLQVVCTKLFVLTVILKEYDMETSRQSSSLFVRQSSGLVREASAFDAMIFNAVFSAPVGATLAFGIFYALGTSPGADIVLALLIAFVVNIPVRIFTQYEPVLMVSGALRRSSNHETVFLNRET